MTNSADLERTLAIIKPDAVQRRLIGQILGRFECKGLRIAAMKMIRMDSSLAERHYAVHKGKSFYEPLIEFITSGPVVVLALEGFQAVKALRNMMGTTDPLNAAPGSIRGDFATEVQCNLVHGSDSPENAQHELSLFFTPEEYVSYND